MNPFNYLSKSSFILGLNCRTKLFYYKNDFPRTIKDYDHQLIEDGYKIGKFAQIVYGPGIDLNGEGDFEVSLAKTDKILRSADNAVVFEATFLINNRLARVDVLEKTGKQIKIKEVKSKSLFDKDGTRRDLKKKGKGIMADWLKYYQDIAYQYIVVKKYVDNARLDLQVEPFLVLVNNNAICGIDGLSFMFEALPEFGLEENWKKVKFTGDTDAVKKNNILIEIDVKEYIMPMLSFIEEQSGIFVEDLAKMPEGIKYSVPISTKCEECEFTNVTKSGYSSCWGDLGEVKPHIFDLFYGKSIGSPKKRYLDELISNKTCSLYDINKAHLLTGERGDRQRIQIDYTQADKSWFSDALKEKLNGYAYPLCFIDFETARLKIPAYKGLRPNSLLAFQWSCHTIDKVGSEPRHDEFLCDRDEFPNFLFIDSLRKLLPNEGTRFMWYSYELTVLREIFSELKKLSGVNGDLLAWLEMATQETYFVDMCKFCIDGFFHPEMKGSNSLKSVLPAVWVNYKSLNSDPWFKKYYKLEGEKVADPYKTLPSVKIIDQLETIEEGTGAIIGYQNYITALNKGDNTNAQSWRQLLLQYCELDTMAMVMVWKHWMNLAARTGQEFETAD